MKINDIFRSLHGNLSTMKQYLQVTIYIIKSSQKILEYNNYDFGYQELNYGLKSYPGRFDGIYQIIEMIKDHICLLESEAGQYE